MTSAIRPPGPSRGAMWCLELLTSRERASAILGDLVEDQARHVDSRPTLSRRLRLEAEVWRHVAAELLSLTPRAFRSAALVLRDTWRSLKSTPSTTAFALAVLTLGISAATVTYSIVDAVILRPLPFPDADQLAVVRERSDLDGSFWMPKASVYHKLRDEPDAFVAVAAYTRDREQLQTAGGPVSVQFATVTASLFDVLRVRPMIGRSFDATSESEGHQDVAVIGYGLWQRYFGGDPAVVGRNLSLGARRLTVIGVMPPTFAYPIDDDRGAEIWTPLAQPGDEKFGVQIVGRLAPNASIQAVNAHAVGLQPASDTTTESRLTSRLEASSLSDALFGPTRGWMLLALVAVVLVLFVACANVANLLLARATRRARDLSIRAAIGASRRYLVATMLAESLGLSLVAAAFSLLLVSWAVGAARAALPAGITRANDIALSGRVFSAALVMAIATGLVFGAVPAWQATRGSLVAILGRENHRVAAGSRWRAVFLVAQVAFVAMLLVATTLFVGSFVRVTIVDLGFDRRHVLAAERPGVVGPLADISDAIRSVPGVTAVGAYADGVPPLMNRAGRLGVFGGSTGAIRLWRPDDGSGESVPAQFLTRMHVAPGYFVAAGTPLIDGRDFLDEERGRSDRVVLDALTARRLFASRRAVGATVNYLTGTPAMVVGVVESIRDGGPEAAVNPVVYLPVPSTEAGRHWLVRTSGDPRLLVQQVEATLDRFASTNGRKAIARPIEDAFRQITASRRFAAMVMAMFGVLALLIGAVGLYGVMTSVVGQRTREIGIRIALGATPHTITAAIVRQTVWYLAGGLTAGLAAGLLATRGFAAIFFGVRPTDVLVYAVVAAVMFATGLAAALVPARRAARIDPQITLRCE